VIRICFIADYYLGWHGGITIFSAMLNSLYAAIEGDHNFEIFVLASSSRYSRLNNESSNLTHVNSLQSFKFDDGDLMNDLLESCPQLNDIYFYKDFYQAIKHLCIDVVGPTTIDLGEKCSVPWFGYIPDFQHLYLPGFFSAEECINRNNHFYEIVKNSNALFLNSYTVIDDVKRFYPFYSKNKKLIKFPAHYPKIYFDNPENDKVTNLIPKTPYFISCSQAWVHKQHDLILEGFENFLSNSNSPHKLVFTGSRNDYRNNIFREKIDRFIESTNLRDRIIHTDVVDRKTLHSLIFRAEAIIQASLFEGGPGASGTMEAAMLGTTIIASDIAANMEMDLGKTFYFDKKSYKSLSNVMSMVSSKKGQRINENPFKTIEFDSMRIVSGKIFLSQILSVL
jgi:glycosyltransferase involved in cell wall biosynthesis